MRLAIIVCGGDRLLKLDCPNSTLARPTSLEIKEHFVPLFSGENLHAYCKPAMD